MTRKPDKISNVTLKVESPEPRIKQLFIEELFVITSKINMFEMKVETPPGSPLVTVIDPDDQPMWSSTKTVALTPSFAIIQLPISNNFFIKGTHLQMIRENQFDGRIQSNPHRHVADFLEISNLFQYDENHEEAVMLRTFPFLLSREAKIWLNELDEGTITSWNELREDFVSRYLSPFKHETFIEAWLRMKEMCRTCYGHGLTRGAIIQTFYHGLNYPTHGILNAGAIFLYKAPNEAFKILEDKVHLKLDFSNDSQNSLKPKTVVFASGSNIYSNYAIFTEKLEPLATKIDSNFLII
ncbi:hypothetical protein Tco_0841678 [Tanacetum coccineum]|uniref:Retrotransposon gag domain-containing protein n=1 Tax=Tanacetum coccineum TaxID=301880 RepID=A0ABQ5B1E0_9ASTR